MAMNDVERSVLKRQLVCICRLERDVRHSPFFSDNLGARDDNGIYVYGRDVPLRSDDLCERGGHGPRTSANIK